MCLAQGPSRSDVGVAPTCRFSILSQAQAQLYEHNKTNKITCIDKQKALKRDYIYNIENADLEIGVSGVLLCIV